MKTMILAAALGATMLGGAAGAQSAAPDNDAMPPRAHMHRGAGGAAMLMEADLNHDGVITRAEAATAADQRFAAMDTNHDGTVTRDERRAQMMQRREAWRERADASGDMRPRADGQHGRRLHGKRKGMRGDRTVTQAQSRERALKMFDRIDTDHNGTVDANEIAAAKLLMRARMADRRSDRAPAPISDGDQQ